MKEKRFILFLIALVTIGLLFRAYGNYIIRSARLVSVDDNGYIIAYGINQEAHNYIFEN